jgi:hypothetical protein
VGVLVCVGVPVSSGVPVEVGGTVTLGVVVAIASVAVEVAVASGVTVRVAVEVNGAGPVAVGLTATTLAVGEGAGVEPSSSEQPADRNSEMTAEKRANRAKLAPLRDPRIFMTPPVFGPPAPHYGNPGLQVQTGSLPRPPGFV